ncbi:MAG: hypothetical protein WDN04_11990 [Rhodospirillales bacterium]
MQRSFPVEDGGVDFFLGNVFGLDAEIFVGEFGVVDFDAEVLADGGQELGDGAGSLGVGCELFVEAGGGFADQRGVVGVSVQDDAEAFADGDPPGVGADGGVEGGLLVGGVLGEAGLKGDAAADGGGEPDVEQGRVDGF